MIRRVLITAVLALLAQSAAATYYVFAGGAFTFQSTPQVTVPNVVGQASSAAADTILMAAMLDLGGVSARCSSAALNQVIGQDPAPGALADVGSLVNVLTSNGVACKNSGTPGVRLKGMRRMM